MKKWKSNLFPVITLAVCLGLAACGVGRKPLEITVVNRTTYPVEDIRIRETDGKDWGENRLETTLAQGESIKIDLGKYTVEELDRGFQVQFYGEDGTYRYEDFTQDGQILVVNTVEPTRLVPEVQDLEDYLIACAFALSDTDTYELLSAEENEEYTENLTYPVYIVTYIAGENEDTRKWTVFAMDTDRYTYLYGFCEAVDTEEDMDEIYQSIFSQLYLSDEN